MSRVSWNFVLAYVLLVGLPLLGLAGVLRSGRTLVAPISIDGTWQLDADAKPSAGYPCPAASNLVSSPLQISQSGLTFVVTFGKNKAELPGTLEGKTLKASSLPGPDTQSGTCSGPFTLTATVDPKSDPRSLTGALSVPACSSCEPIAFHAVRQPKPQAGAGH
jgi:hypothetical protein